MRSRPQLPCPTNTFSMPGAGSAQDCVPSPGYYGGSGTNAANPCPSGNYCPGDGSIVRCPLGTTSAMLTTSKAGCSILAGFYGRCADFRTQDSSYFLRFLASAPALPTCNIHTRMHLKID